MAYKLQLPKGTRIHLVFHISLLKPYHQSSEASIVISTELPPFTDEGVVILEPQKLLDRCWINQGTKFIEETLVQWKHITVEEATWELSAKFKILFPKLNLEDKI